MESTSARRAKSTGRRARVCLSLGLGALLACVAIAAAASDGAVYRDRTVAVLDEIASAESGFGLQAWVNDGSLADIAIGQTVQYHFLSDRSAYLTVLHVDSHGVLTLIHPNAIVSGASCVAESRRPSRVPRTSSPRRPIRRWAATTCW